MFSVVTALFVIAGVAGPAPVAAAADSTVTVTSEGFCDLYPWFPGC